MTLLLQTKTQPLKHIGTPMLVCPSEVCQKRNFDNFRFGAFFIDIWYFNRVLLIYLGNTGCFRRVARIFRGGRGGDACWKWRYRLVGGPGTCSTGNILETLKCLGLHFARFHGGEREKDNLKNYDSPPKGLEKTCDPPPDKRGKNYDPPPQNSGPLLPAM